MNGHDANGKGRGSSYSRVFLVLGWVVVGAVVLRLARAGYAALAVMSVIPGPSPFAGPRVRVLLLFTLALGLVVVAVAVGVIRRRPAARAAAIALLAAGAASGLGIALFQLSSLMRGVDRSPEAAEIGYGAVLSQWRIASVIVGLVAAVFCGAALRRFASEDMRREFAGPPRTGIR